MLSSISYSKGTDKANGIGIGGWERTSGDGKKLPIEGLYSYPSLKRERKVRTFFDRKLKKKFTFLLDKPFWA
jgi:hypothetical protein